MRGKNTLGIILVALLLKTTSLYAQKYNVDMLRKKTIRFNFDTAIIYADSFLQQAEQLNGKEDIEYYSALFEKAIVYEKFDKFNKAILLLIELSKRSKELPPSLQAMIPIETSLIYEKLGLYDSCMMELDRARNIIAKYNLDSIKTFYHLRRGSAIRVFDRAYIARPRVEGEARYHIDSAIYYGNKYKNPYWLSHIYFVDGVLLAREEDALPDRIKNSLYRSIHYALIVDDKSIYMSASSSLIKLHSRLGRTDSALYIAEKCLDIVRQHNATNKHGSYITSSISELYENIGMLDSALAYQKLATLYGIEAALVQSSFEITELKAEHENVSRKLLLESQQIELKAKKRQVQLWIALSVILVIFTISLYDNNRRTRRLLKKNQKQKEEIEAINADLNDSLQKQNILQKELHHRVKNNLQIIIGLLELQEEKSEVVKSIGQQIHSIAAGHELLYQDDIKGELSLNEYLNELLSHFPEESQLGATIKIDCKEDIETGLETLIPIGLIINELITNSIKYAIQPGKHLNIDIDAKLNAAKDKIMINYRDNGPGFSNAEEGFGSFVINTMVMQLEGEMNVNSDGGVHYAIELSL